MLYQAAHKTAAHAEPLAWIKALKVAFSWWETFWSWTFCSLSTDVWHHHRDFCLMQASYVLLYECASQQGTCQQLCYRGDPDGSIRWTALGDRMIARGGGAWQTSRVSSVNSVSLHLLWNSESNNYCFLLPLLIYLWSGLQLSPCCSLILAIILAMNLSNYCCLLTRKCALPK